MEPWSPYCGSPPAPQEIWSRWTLDPWLIGALLFCAVAGFIHFKSCDARRDGRPPMFWAGFATVALAFLSPLCALSMALFSARVGQHLILTLIAAPLLAAAIPSRYGQGSAAILSSAMLFAVLFWFWHLPAPYAATLASDAAYWAMHLSLLGAVVWCWRGLIDFRPDAIGAALASAALSAIQMSLLSALLFFSQAPWHRWHDVAARPWGLDGITDQQIGALLMWVPGAIVFMMTLFAIVATMLARAGGFGGQPVIRG